MEKWERELEQMTQLKDAFADTCKLSVDNEILADSVKHSMAGQEIILEKDDFRVQLHGPKDGNVIISKKRTFEAAKAYKGRKTAVLNFASAEHPSGYGDKGTLTQEECLCRESTLYTCLHTLQCSEQFYKPHRELNWYYNSDLIYTPDVTVFKTYDLIPKLMDENDWFNVDVITMAAPNASLLFSSTGQVKERDQLLYEFEKRFTRVMLVAASYNVDVLILGAFGCGAFGNEPGVVATGAGRALDKLSKEFDTIEFAIYEKGKKKNYNMFRLVLDRYRNDDERMQKVWRT